MSIKLMAAAWELDIPSTEKMVLLCLCDFAGDGGACWPSVPTIARKCSKSERTVQTAIQWLRDAGYCSWNDAPGKPHRFTLNPRKICTPAESAPPQKMSQTPAELAPKPLRRTIRKKERARAIKQALPANWWPVEFGSGTQSRMIVDGWPPGELERQVEAFSAHHLARGNAFEDWQQAWSTWVLNSEKFNRGQQNGRASSSHDEPKNPYVRAAADGIARRQAERTAAERG